MGRDETVLLIRVSPSLPVVEVFVPLVELVYRNLISNALHHVETDGFTLRCTAEQRDGTWVFGVENTGSTVEEQDRERLLDPYVHRGSDPERSGLGLSICKRVVERHQGRIWVEGDPGTVHFRFTLGV